MSDLDKHERRLLRNIVDEGWVLSSDLDDHDVRRVIFLIALKYVTVETASEDSGYKFRYPLIVPTKSGRAVAHE